MIDVDHFKFYNDAYGHQAGDDCLRQVADILAVLTLRPGDLLARYGGEEFTALLPSTTVEGASAAAQRVLERFESECLRHAASPAGRVTVSIGIAAGDPSHAGTVTNLIEAADQALYEAKRSGRDRIGLHLADPGALDTARAALIADEDDGLDDMFLSKPLAEAGAG